MRKPQKSDGEKAAMRWYVVLPLVIGYVVLAYYGIRASEAETKRDEMQQQFEREHGL